MEVSERGRVRPRFRICGHPSGVLYAHKVKYWLFIYELQINSGLVVRLNDRMKLWGCPLAGAGDAMVSILFPADCRLCTHLLTRASRVPSSCQLPRIIPTAAREYL